MKEGLAKLGGAGRAFMSKSLQTIFFFPTKWIADVSWRPVVPTI